MMTVEDIRRAQRAQGPATVLAIGTSTPANCVDQSTYPDYYFRITNSEHMTDLKEKFVRMCKLLEYSIFRVKYLIFLNNNKIKITFCVNTPNTWIKDIILS